MTSKRRAYGTGSLAVRTDKAGRQTFYGYWREGSRRVYKRIGVKRTPGSREGLTPKQAENVLREKMQESTPQAQLGERLTLAEAGRRYRTHLAGQELKAATTTAVESTFRIWLDPILGDKALDSITPSDVEDLMRSMAEKGLSPKSIRNYVGTLSALFKYSTARRRGWARANPCEEIELPKRKQAAEIHYLSSLEVDSLASAAIAGEHERLDRALYVTAAMTGLRQGELIALRWRDVDWNAQRIRVRRSYVLGKFDAPKSRRSIRSVPMNRRVVSELDAWHQRTAWKGDDALVFAEPVSGDVLRRGALMRRYRRALNAAKLSPTHRFHDLRHTFGTAMAAAGVPMRTLQELMGHASLETTLIYADYVPSAEEVAMADRAFADSLPLPPESRSANILPI